MATNVLLAVLVHWWDLSTAKPGGFAHSSSEGEVQKAAKGQAGQVKV